MTEDKGKVVALNPVQQGPVETDKEREAREYFEEIERQNKLKQARLEADRKARNAGVTSSYKLRPKK